MQDTKWLTRAVRSIACVTFPTYTRPIVFNTTVNIVHMKCATVCIIIDLLSKLMASCVTDCRINHYS